MATSISSRRTRLNSATSSKRSAKASDASSADTEGGRGWIRSLELAIDSLAIPRFLERAMYSLLGGRLPFAVRAPAFSIDFDSLRGLPFKILAQLMPSEGSSADEEVAESIPPHEHPKRSQAPCDRQSPRSEIHASPPASFPEPPEAQSRSQDEPPHPDPPEAA